MSTSSSYTYLIPWENKTFSLSLPHARHWKSSHLPIHLSAATSLEATNGNTTFRIGFGSSPKSDTDVSISRDLDGVAPKSSVSRYAINHPSVFVRLPISSITVINRPTDIETAHRTVRTRPWRRTWHPRNSRATLRGLSFGHIFWIQRRSPCASVEDRLLVCLFIRDLTTIWKCRKRKFEINVE